MVDELSKQWRESGLPEPTIQVRGTPDEEVTTTVDVRDLARRKRDAFAAHLSQNNPDNPFQTMAGQIFESAFGYESFVLARGDGAGRTGSDIFAGVG
jgi:LmbE family N-acetylglucosaminyl deacetylase